MAIYWGSGKPRQGMMWEPRDIRKLSLGLSGALALTALAIGWEHVWAGALDFFGFCRGFVNGFSMPEESPEYLASWDTARFFGGIILVIVAIFAITAIIEANEALRSGRVVIVFKGDRTRDDKQG